MRDKRGHEDCSPSHIADGTLIGDAMLLATEPLALVQVQHAAFRLMDAEHPR
jgi:hypothetical protein